jgi:hypothetical protein
VFPQNSNFAELETSYCDAVLVGILIMFSFLQLNVVT